MPVIPVVQESLRSQTSSPVPIDNSGESHLMGTAIENAGRAMNALGVELEKQARERDKIIAADAQAGWENFMLQQKAQVTREGVVEGDEDGTKTLKVVETNGREYADQIREGLNPNAAQLFTAKINDRYVNEYNPQIRLEAGKDLMAKGKAALDKTVNSFSSLAANNPDDFQAILTDTLETVQNNNLLTSVEKSQKMAEVQDTMFGAALEGFRDRRDFDGGKNFIQIYGSGMDPKARKELVKELDNQKWEDYSRERAILENGYQDTDRSEQKRSDKVLADITAQYAAAPTEVVRQKVLESAVAMRKAGILQEGAFNAALGLKDKLGRADDSTFISVQILNPMTDGKFPDGKAFSFDQARARVMDATVGTNPQISSATANEWVMKLNQMERSMKTDPIKLMNLREAYKRAEQYGKTGTQLTKALAGLNDDTRDLARILRVKQNLAWATANNVDPLSVVDSYSAQSMGTAPVQSFNKIFIPSGVANDPEKAGRWLLDQKAKGVYKTAPQKKAYKEALKEVINMRQNRQKQEQVREYNNSLLNIPQKQKGQ